MSESRYRIVSTLGKGGMDEVFLADDTQLDRKVALNFLPQACGEEWDTSQAHFETALKEADEMPHKIAQPDVRRWHAWMLLERDAVGDCDKARACLGEAIEMYRTIGMPKHLEMAEKTLDNA